MGIKKENYDKIRKHFIKLLGGECAFCHTKENLQFDHITPYLKDVSTISRSKREWHWFDEYEKKNIQLLCSKCNNMKNDSYSIWFCKENAII